MGIYAAIFAIGLAGLVGVYFKGHSDGAESRNPEIVQLRSAIATSERIALDAVAKAEKAAGTVRVEYRDRVRTIVKEAEAQIQLVEVIKREVDPNCSMPPSFRGLWDGPTAPGSATAQDSLGTPVPLGDLAEATAEARRRFESNKAKLDSLQAYLKAIQ